MTAWVILLLPGRSTPEHSCLERKIIFNKGLVHFLFALGVPVMHSYLCYLFHVLNALRVPRKNSQQIIFYHQLDGAYHWLFTVQVLPDSQQVGPLNPCPPHCCHLPAQLVVGGGLETVGTAVVVVVVPAGGLLLPPSETVMLQDPDEK